MGDHDAPCVGHPESWQPGLTPGSSCDRYGNISLLQLRPVQGVPTYVWLTACSKHARPVRIWMRASWHEDDVDTFGTRYLLEHLDEWMPNGVQVLRGFVAA